MTNYNNLEQPQPIKSPLRLLRERANKTQSQLAHDIGVSDRRIRDWEKGLALPSMENAAVLAQYYKVSLKEIFKAVGIDVSGIPDDVSLNNG